MALEGIKHSWQGYYYVIPDTHFKIGYGKGSETHSTVIRGNTPEEVEAEVRKYLRAIKDNSIDRTSYYKKAGRKKGGNRKLQAQRDLAKLFGNINAVIQGGAIIGHAKTMEWSANQILERTIEKIEYDNYTGNLENAYKVTIISGRKKAKEIWYDKAKKGVIEFGPKGGRFVERTVGRHKFKGKKFRGKEGRYMRKWEKSRGYQNDKHSVTASIDKNWSGGKYGEWKAQGAIYIENVAPYAGAVQVGSPGYRVLSPAQRNKIAKKQETLVQLYIGKTLRQAGFIR